MVCQWYGHGMLVVWVWCVSGMGMVCQWYGHGVLVVRTWCVSGMGMVCQWYGHDVLVVRTWCVSGMGMVCQWYGHGMLVVSMLLMFLRVFYQKLAFLLLLLLPNMAAFNKLKIVSEVENYIINYYFIGQCFNQVTQSYRL